jgi:hypothetical protein
MTFGDSWKFGEGYDESRKVFERYYSAGGNFVGACLGPGYFFAEPRRLPQLTL